MSERVEIACAAAQRLRRLGSAAPMPRAVLGFDGFVDAIIDVVHQRHSVEQYEPVPTIATFGQQVCDAAGQSANFELVTRRQKLGGNGPIMADALALAGVGVSYVGGLGRPRLHPVFHAFAERASLHSIAEPGYTDALEFTDGKLMLGKHDHLPEINLVTLDRELGREAFTQMLARASLIAMLNWTMLTRVGSIWQAMADEMLPALPALADGRRRMIFIDLADPRKRSRADLAEALKLIGRMDGHANAVLGLNLSEAGQVAEVLGLKLLGEDDDALKRVAAEIREAMDIHGVVIHPRTGAAAAVRDESGAIEQASFQGPFTERPKLSTGAGDNFNAGFCLAQLAELPLEQSLCVATATSGFYVRNAQSPTLDELAAFCEQLPQPCA